eukprot:2844-Hanusia_phi.AAC.1
MFYMSSSTYSACFPRSGPLILSSPLLSYSIFSSSLLYLLSSSQVLILQALLLPFLYDSVHERGRHRLLSPLSYNSGHIKPAGTTFVMLAGEMPG